MAFTDLLASGDSSLRALLGETVTYTPGVGSAVDVQGVFDAAYVRVDVGQPGVSSVSPAVFVGLDDLTSDPESDSDAEVTVDGTDYVIREVQKDGKGGVLLLLHRAD